MEVNWLKIVEGFLVQQENILINRARKESQLVVAPSAIGASKSEEIKENIDKG